MNCLHLFRTKNKLESHNKVYENKDIGGVAMHSEGTKVLEINQYQKCDKASYITHADLESLTKKMDGCKNNSEKPFITKVGEHIPCGYLISMIWTYDGSENNCRQILR